MKKRYLDLTNQADCISIFVKDTQIIPAGTTLSSMPVRHKNAEYDRYARDYDIHFLFEDHLPQPIFTPFRGWIFSPMTEAAAICVPWKQRWIFKAMQKLSMSTRNAVAFSLQKTAGIF